METTTRARALRATPILVLAFLMAGGGAAPAPTTTPVNPNAAQVLAAETGAPELASEKPSLGAPALPALQSSERRVAEYTADAIAEAAADARREARARGASRSTRASARGGQGPGEGASGHPGAAGLQGHEPLLDPEPRHEQQRARIPVLAQRPPDNYMYRWGCAGENNVYILGHAYSVMKPLHDLYVRGGLEKGMVAIYANGNGKVTKYRVTEWRVVDPVDSHWAIADQPVAEHDPADLRRKGRPVAPQRPPRRGRLTR